MMMVETQVAMIDANGNVASHTGVNAFSMRTPDSKIIQFKQILWRNPRLRCMGHAFENTKGDLVDRMMASLEAAENEGGDLRGKQSASMPIVTGTTGVAWKDIVMDIRIDDHKEPLKELKCLIRINRAYKQAPRAIIIWNLKRLMRQWLNIKALIITLKTLSFLLVCSYSGRN